MADDTVVEADLTWLDGRFQRGVKVRVGTDGTITEAGALAAPTTLRLERRALLPGFANAHSHAFQRGLRGKGERFPSGAGSFWSWREAMYSLVERVTPDDVYAICSRTYREMLRAGITSVGEFHYLHHADADARDHALDEAVIRAAADSGIRLVLLFTYYRTGGIGKPLGAAQQRFNTPSPRDFWQAFDRAAKLLRANQSIGVVAHSIRAATPDEIAELFTEARRRRHVFHMHVEEQKLELLDCEAEYGKTPMQLLLDRLPSLDGFTAVHCTHSDTEALQEFVRRGGVACITPLTEANLGDGIPRSEAFRGAEDHVALGTDSNARISMIEEMRWLEYAQRLRYESRGIFADGDGAVGKTLLDIATRGGARSLGIDAGSIESGRAADFCTISLDAPSLVGAPESALEDALIFGAGDDVLAETCVAGTWLPRRT